MFYKGSDLLELGGFNPWVTIEDPEVGLRLWVNKRRLGIVAAPLIEEVPNTLRGGITQRKRWVCGFLQASHSPLVLMGMTARQRVRARLNLWPCLFLAINPIGIPLGIWAMVAFMRGRSPVPDWFTVVCTFNIVALTLSLAIMYASTWKRTRYVLARRGARLKYMFRVNPFALWIFWLIWTIPIVIGIKMFLSDGGRVWERTEKIDANHVLVRQVISDGEIVQTTADAVRIV